jgi:hypothetical protein
MPHILLVIKLNAPTLFAGCCHAPALPMPLKIQHLFAVAASVGNQDLRTGKMH